MPDQFTAYLRTYWPLFVGTVTGLLVTWVAQHLGLTINSTAAGAVVGAVMVAIVYALGRWLERSKWPPGAALGRWLISAGRKVGQPTYQPVTPQQSKTQGE